MASAEVQLRNALHRKLLSLGRNRDHSFSAHELVSATVYLVRKDVEGAAKYVQRRMDSLGIPVDIEIKKNNVFKVKFPG